MSVLYLYWRNPTTRILRVGFDCTVCSIFVVAAVGALYQAGVSISSCWDSICSIIARADAVVVVQKYLTLTVTADGPQRAMNRFLPIPPTTTTTTATLAVGT